MKENLNEYQVISMWRQVGLDATAEEFEMTVDELKAWLGQHGQCVGCQNK